jgi:uncharacterized C2H2 Zn-finger protein
MPNKILYWLTDHCPVWCKRCGYVMFARNARYSQHVTGSCLFAKNATMSYTRRLEANDESQRLCREV